MFQAYVKGVEAVKARLTEDDPECVSLQLDAWTAHHTGYMGAILSMSLLGPLFFYPKYWYSF